MEFNLNSALDNYNPIDVNERESLKRIKDFLYNNENCFSRTNLKGHITAGALVIDEDGNVLLNHHKALNKWLGFGGHSDGEINSLNVAKREVMEESGIHEIDVFEGRIFDVDVHVIPDNPLKKEPEHYHYDIRFLFIVKNKEFKISDESKEIKWISIKEARELVDSQAMKRMLEKAEKVYLKMF